MRTLCLCLLAVSTVASGSPVHLRTNSTENPIGIDTPQPSFSWRSDAVRPGWTQAGYEIRVASTAAALLKRGADVWDSGRVSSAESVNIPYAGPAIKPQTHYVWSVTTWDDRGRAEVSRPAWFETGLTTAESWKGAWILRTDAQRDAQLATVRWIWLPGVDAMHVAPAAKAQFRYILRLPSQPVAASMHVVARGNFTARVNGHETGHHSNWGAFDREEIQPYLHAGDNEIILEAETDRARPPALDTPAALAVAIRIEDATGAEKLIVSGAAWQARRASTDAWVQAQDAGPLSKQFLLGTNRFGAAPGPTRLSTDASLFRKDFSVQQKIVSARLTMTALGAYVAYINGQPVAPGTLLSPGWTDFTKRVLYQTYDVTPLLRHGRNAIGVELGGGWYSSPLTWAGFRSTPGPNLLRGQLDLTFADGSHQVIATDETWRTAPSPITFSEIYGGESYDGRLAQAGWNTAEFQDKQWAASQRSPVEPQATLTAQPDLLVQTHITIHPIKLDSANAQHPTVYDMGQNMVGNIRLHVQGARGTLVKLRYAERLNADGSIYTENLRNADATDTYALTGKGEETWTPEFTFHGFRYVELSFPSSNTMPPPTLSTIEGLVYNSLPATPSVKLMSSSETLNKMNELGIWGQRGNFVSIPTDCPQRDERLGWMGDAGVFWRTGTYNFDIQSFTHKFMLDITDAQTAEGAFTDVSPNILGPNPGAPGWGDAGVSIPYAAWLQYGDSTVAARAWPSMERWMSFILENNPGYLRQHALGANYADWLAPDPNTPPDLIGTAYWAIDAHQMAELANALHKPEESAKYQAEFEHIASAYRAAYVSADGTVKGGTQTAYLATIATEIAPPKLRSSMMDRLAKDIEAHGNHLTTGFLGTPFLLFVLDENNREDLAFKLLLSEDYPSWGYMVKKGATTWWERWNGDTGDPGMNSYNHYAFGSVMAWVYRRAAGIDTDASAPGFRHLTIHPHFDRALPALHVEYDSDYGTIVSDWKQDQHRFTVMTPANTTATVILPDGRKDKVGSGTHTYLIP